MALVEFKELKVNSRTDVLLAVPDHVREFIATHCGVPSQCPMFVHPNELQKVYVQHNGVLQYVDFKSSHEGLQVQTPVMDPLAAPAEAFCSVVEGLSHGLASVSMDAEDKGSIRKPHRPSLTTEKIAPLNEIAPKTSVSLNMQLQPVPPACCHGKIAAVMFESKNCTSESKPASRFSGVSHYEWYFLTDAEREVLQRARRRANAYKTALCHSFKNSGTCVFGENCRFAHGEDELRLPPQKHPKYKTQLCNKFTLFGECPYGARCQFIHLHTDGQANFSKKPPLRAFGAENDCPSEILQNSSTSPRSLTFSNRGHCKTEMFHSGEGRGNITQSESIVSAAVDGKMKLTSSVSQKELKTAVTHWEEDSTKTKLQYVILGRGSHEQTNAKSGEAHNPTLVRDASEPGCPASTFCDYGLNTDDSGNRFTQSCFSRILSDLQSVSALSPNQEGRYCFPQ